ncbi:MAG: DNA primase [Patescibacteria group bacterium]
MAQDNIEEIKSKIDVVDLVQEYIQIKPAGTNNFKANCPFHHEKTPSFMVSRDKQIWHCFGCGEGGDIFSFVMKMEGLEFPEALRVLAKKAGVQLQYRDPALNNQKTKLQDICRYAAEFYHKILLDHPKAQSVRDYLKKRQVKDETVETWTLGFAPDAWETLSDFLIKKGFGAEDIFLAGLTVKKERGSGYYDRFRNRLMFPVRDPHGTIIGFGGRWLGPDRPEAAKYVNSPQTLIYDKSHILYGFDQAKQAIKQEKLAVVVEGYMDCIASHQAGVENVVASSGTALTLEQVKLIKRMTVNVAFAFDQDIAGDTASRRGIEVAWQEEMNTKVIRIVGAKDPDDLIKMGPELWRQAIQGAQSVMDYYFASVLGSMDVKKVENKKTAAKTLLGVIAKLSDKIEQTHYLQKLSVALSVPEDVLRDTLQKVKIRAVPEATPDQSAVHIRDRYTAIGETVVGIVLRYPSLLPQLIDQLPPEHIVDVKLQNLYKSLVVFYTEKQTFDFDAFLKSLPGDDKKSLTYAEILSLRTADEYPDADPEALEKEVRKGVKELKKRHIQGELKKIEQAMRQAEMQGDSQAIEAQSLMFSELAAELRHLEE